jgi:hypothetical protein
MTNTNARPPSNYEDVTAALLSMGIPDPETEILPPPHTHARTEAPGYKDIQLGRDMQMWALRIRGFSQAQIAKHFSTNTNQVTTALRRAANSITLELPEHVIKLELERLDYLLTKALDVLEAEHHAFNHGKVMYNLTTGQPYIDSGPTLAAIDKCLKIQERRAKLLGLDKDPNNSQTEDTIESELQNMIDEVNARAEELKKNAQQ